MRKKLILITNEFPYGFSEPYLEAELPYLSDRFEDIIILPINIESSSLRNVMDNVSIRPFIYNKNYYKVNRWKIFKLHAKGLLEFAKEIFLYFRSYGVLPRRSMYNQLIDFLKKGTQIKDLINFVIKDVGFSPSETVIYSYWAAHSAIAAAMLKKELPQLHVISRAHGWDVYFERIITRYIPLRPFIMNSIDTLYPISAQGAFYLDAKLRFAFKNKIEVRNLGVEILNFKKRNKNDFVRLHLVSCSRLVKLKRINLIIEALSHLRNTIYSIKVHWTHLGGGQLQDILKNQAKEALSGQNIITYDFKGNLSHEEVVNFYKTANVDLFVSTSEWEGLPVSIMEAASFSIPIIATDVGGVSEIVIDGRNGWLISKNLTSKQLSNKLEKWIFLSQDVKQKFCVQSRKIAEKRFCAENNYRDWAEELISK